MILSEIIHCSLSVVTGWKGDEGRLREVADVWGGKQGVEEERGWDGRCGKGERD